jgi:mercuric ion transport protein
MALHGLFAAARPAGTSTPASGAAKSTLDFVGIATGIGAIAASSCCVVPLVLATFGAGAGVFGMLEALTPWRVALLVISGFGVALGWFVWWRKRSASREIGSACAKPSSSRISLALLLVASLIVASAISWGYLEPALLKLMVRHA